MRVVLISGHDASSDRKTGFHFWAEILARREIDVYFVTVGSSPISLLKKDGKQLKPPFNRWVTISEHIRKFTWLPVFHPVNFDQAWINYLTWPLFSLYPHLMPKKLLEPLTKADYFVVENGAGQMLVPRLAKLNPKARFIFNSSDRPSVVKFHPIVVESERKMLPYVDLIRLNAAAMAEDFPEDVDTHYIPQAIDKKLFDTPMENPYKGPKNAINVGDMIFDPTAVEVLAENFPDWTFHLFGKKAHTSKPLANVIEYKEMPFEKLVPYLQHADIGLAPYQDTPQAAYLGQSSLKMVQYTYCKMPIVAPKIAAGKRDNILSYSSSRDAQSVVKAFQSAKNFDRTTIDRNTIPSWEDVIDRMMTLAKEQSNTMKVIFLLTTLPHTKCGVGDYTIRLVESMKEAGIEAHIEWLDKWSIKAVNQISKKYKNQKNVAFHMQYPSLGMGHSPVPGLLPLMLAPHPVYITLHEFSIFNILRKAIFLIPAMMAKNIIFTNEYERQVFRKFFPLASRKFSVVPIGENIPVVPLDPKPVPARDRIIYFGQISSGKGIELFLDTVRLLRSQNAPVDAAIIGSIVNDNDPITQAVKQAAQRDGVELCLNYSAEKVSEELQKSTIALLAFPDGITEKRGSALACMKHGNTLMTIHSNKTPEWLRKATHNVGSAQSAAAAIIKMIGGGNRSVDETAMTEPMERREWPNIAKSHISLYRRHVKA